MSEMVVKNTLRERGEFRLRSWTVHAVCRGPGLHRNGWLTGYDRHTRTDGRRPHATAISPDLSYPAVEFTGLGGLTAEP